MMIPIKSTRWNCKVSTMKVALTRHRIQQLYASLMWQQPTIDCPWTEVLNGVHPKRSPTSIVQASIINFNTQRCLKKACIPQIAQLYCHINEIVCNRGWTRPSATRSSYNTTHQCWTKKNIPNCLPRCTRIASWKNFIM